MTPSIISDSFHQMHSFSSGEYVKDLDQILIDQDPLLDYKVPRPLVERGYCSGTWSNFDSQWPWDQPQPRDCWDSDMNGYEQPLSRHPSQVKHRFRCAIISTFNLSKCIYVHHLNLLFHDRTCLWRDKKISSELQSTISLTRASLQK